MSFIGVIAFGPKQWTTSCRMSVKLKDNTVQTVKMHLFVLQKLWEKKDIPNMCFCPGLNMPGSIDTMAAWWNEGKHVVVNDRTPQSLMNSSSLIWVDPRRALADLRTPAPGARLTPVVQRMLLPNDCSQERKCSIVVTQTLGWLMLSEYKCYHRYRNTDIVFVIWCVSG